jgi:hypothetical protein
LRCYYAKCRLQKRPVFLPTSVSDVIKTSIKYLLLLSFLLAFLPSENARQQDVAKTKRFVVVADHIQSFASPENNKKADTEKEDLHPLSSIELIDPVPPVRSVQYSAFSLQLDTTTYYPIRAPPVQA